MLVGNMTNEEAPQYRWKQRGIISLWRYTENSRNYSGWHLTADAAGCASLLELLPPVDAPPVNPLVVAALQRIERAHVQPRFSGNAAVATMLDYEEQSEFGLDVPCFGDDADGSDVLVREDPHHASNRPEKIHNLAVVPPQVEFVSSVTNAAGAAVLVRALIRAFISSASPETWHRPAG